MESIKQKKKFSLTKALLIILGGVALIIAVSKLFELLFALVFNWLFG